MAEVYDYNPDEWRSPKSEASGSESSGVVRDYDPSEWETPEKTRDVYQFHVKDGKLGGTVQQMPESAPLPEGASERPSGIVEDTARLATNLGKGVVNVGHEIGRTTLALGDMAAGLAGQDANMAEWYRDHSAYFKPESTTDAIQMGFGQELPGALAGGAGGLALATKMLGKAAGSMGGRIVKAIASFVGSEIGGGVTRDPDSEMIALDTAAQWIPIFHKFGQDRDGKFSDELLKQKLNQIQDGMIIGFGFGALGAAAVKSARFMNRAFIKAAKNWNNLDVQQKSFVTDVLKAVDEAEPGTVDEKFVELLRENAATLVKLDDSVGDVTVKVDTISAIINTLEKKGEKGKYKAIIDQLESMRKSALVGSSPELQNALEAPVNTLENTLDTMRSKRGNSAVDVAKDRLVQSETDKLTPLKESIAMTESEITRISSNIEKEILNEPTFKPILENLGDKVGIDFTKPVKITHEIVGRLSETARQMSKKKNDLFGAIPYGAKIDPKVYATETVGIQDLLNKDEIEYLKLIGPDFQRLNEFSNLVLAKKVNALRRSKEFVSADRLQDFRKAVVDDQLDYLEAQAAKKGKKYDVYREALSTVETANKYFKDEFKPLWREAKPLRDLQEASWYSSSVDLLTQQGKQIGKTLSDVSEKEYTDRIITALSREEGGVTPELASDYALAKIASKIQVAIGRKGRLTADDLNNLQEEIGRYVPIFDRLAPAKKGQIEAFLTKVRNQDFEIEDLKKNLTKYSQDLSKLEKDVYDGYLKNFFSKQGSEYAGIADGYVGFEKLFKSKDGLNTVKSIMDITASDPMARKGVESAYLRFMKEKFFQPGSGTSRLNAQTTDAFNLGSDSAFMKYGQEIFKDKPAVMEGLKRLAGIANNKAVASQVPQGFGLDLRRSQIEFRKSLGRAITWVFGILNPRAARLRTITDELLTTYDDRNVAKKAADLIMADPDLFADLADEIAREQKYTVSDEMLRRWFRATVNAGIFTDKDEDAFYTGVPREVPEEDSPLKMTSKGRPLHKKGGENYSEKTLTFQTEDGKWVTFPSVLDKKGTISKQKEVEDYVRENGPVDPLTGEVFPTFDSMEAAVSYAKKRSDGITW